MRCSLLTGFLCFTRKCWGQHVGVKLVRGVGPCCAKCFLHDVAGQAACSVTAAALFVFGSQRRQPASNDARQWTAATVFLLPSLKGSLLFEPCLQSAAGHVLTFAGVVPANAVPTSNMSNLHIAHACCKQVQHMLATTNQRVACSWQHTGNRCDVFLFLLPWGLAAKPDVAFFRRCSLWCLVAHFGYMFPHLTETIYIRTVPQCLRTKMQLVTYTKQWRPLLAGFFCAAEGSH